MNFYLDRLYPLVQRMHGYPPHEVAIELAVLWIVVYLILRLIRGTRGARVIKGVALVLISATLVVQILGGGEGSSEAGSFERLTFLYRHFLSAAAIVLLVVFAPELRRGLVRLGEMRMFTGRSFEQGHMIDELIASVNYLSQNKIGALIALERTVGLDGIVESGTLVDAHVTKELLNTIFWPGSALHDMGVVIRGDRLVLAGAQFPLADGESFGTELGSRHRAAVGLSQETDAMVIVVSEETGVISIAESGVLSRHLSLDDLQQTLDRRSGFTARITPAKNAENQAGKNVNDKFPKDKTAAATANLVIDDQP